MRKRDILRRAAEVFERNGYAATSLEEIADAVGVKREAIYYYFKNKAQILSAVIRPQSVSMLEGIDGILKQETSSRDKLFLALQNHIERFNPSFLEMSVLARDQQLLERLPECKDLSKIWRRYSDRWVTLITEGQNSGQFLSTLNPKVVAFTILGMCNWLSRWYDPTKSISATEIVHNYFQLIGGGFIIDFEKASHRADVLDAQRTRPEGVLPVLVEFNEEGAGVAGSSSEVRRRPQSGFLVSKHRPRTRAVTRKRAARKE